jgi:hypothetical protein
MSDRPQMSIRWPRPTDEGAAVLCPSAPADRAIEPSPLVRQSVGLARLMRDGPPRGRRSVALLAQTMRPVGRWHIEAQPSRPVRRPRRRPSRCLCSERYMGRAGHPGGQGGLPRLARRTGAPGVPDPCRARRGRSAPGRPLTDGPSKVTPTSSESERRKRIWRRPRRPSRCHLAQFG